MVVKPAIKGVHVVPMGFSNAFLIEGDDGLTLIDAGFPDVSSGNSDPPHSGNSEPSADSKKR